MTTLLSYFDTLPPGTQLLAVLLMMMLGAWFLGQLLRWLLFKPLRIWIARSDKDELAKILHRHLYRTAAYFLPALLLMMLLSAYESALPIYPHIQKWASILFYLAFGSLFIRLVYAFSDYVGHVYGAGRNADNLQARKVQTQLLYIRQILILGIVLVTAALVMLRFDNVRQVGFGLLSSAGVAGIIIGLAAQQSIKNLLAGLQIAFSQPIRLDDVVIVEGEFGRVEEITLSYVVLRLWDLRRMIVPLSYFIDRPFQNWTRHSADILGSVSLHVDYAMPVAALRQELERIVEGHPLWDGQVAKVQVTDSSERSMSLRILVSAANAGDAFDLRCDLRERLIAFLQQHYPDSLPRFRTENVGTARPQAQPG